ncbi:aminoglycoside phosphotransferase [Streptomyces sp. 150FB]|uniref:phosphotransferase n=1 Tax=Streptomyces sp. 150FB TaxID=1576605 RepID=UPI00058945B4|nr:phosphotransferase [Streptomyces sp. 150FB]KIF73002.1 aminoglycoside phosphotransferase [Streptomyces sp. 150FB]
MPTRVPWSDKLDSSLGRAVNAKLLESSPRSLVWRVGLRDGSRVIVKQITVRGGAGEDADTRYARETAGLRLAGRAAAPAVAPALLATDAESRVMVLEHLEQRADLCAPVGPGLGTNGDWMPGYAESLARLHALTGPDDAGALPAWSGPTPADAASFLALAGTLDVAAPPGAEVELAALVERLGDTPYHALLHGDPCPGNDLHTATGVRFIDFEQASLGNGLVELAYLRIGFPTCWCAMSVTGAPLAEAEEAYRATWRRLTGRDVPGDLADACAGWLIRGDALVERAHRDSTDHLARVPVEDFTWGYVSASERLVHRLGVVAELARDHEALRAVGRLSEAMALRLLERRPGLRPLPPHSARPW